MSKSLREWYRRWNQLAYLSHFERWLNMGLWILLAVAMLFAFLQHVALANIPEAFVGGQRLGSVFYDLAIAYAGAFSFYLLNIRLPLRRDRRRAIAVIAIFIGPETNALSSVPATARFGIIGMGTGGSYRGLDDDISATTGYGMNMVDRLVAIPCNTHTIGTRGEQSAVIGSFNLSTLSHNARFGFSLVHTPGEFDLLMAG